VGLSLASPIPAQDGFIIKQDSREWRDLEKQLWQIEQKWLEAARNKKLDVLKELWTDQFFEINRGGTVPDKDEELDSLSKRPVKPGMGAFPDQFKLRAVYGNVALATDHTAVKGFAWSTANGQDFSGDFRVLRIFVKIDGQWKVAGAAMCPIVAHRGQ